MGVRIGTVLLASIVAFTPLRVTRDSPWFVGVDGPSDYREISAFSLYSRWLQGQHEHVRAWARRAAAHGVSSVRVILTLDGPYWVAQPREWFGHGLASGPHVPGFQEQLVPFVRAMAAEGLRVRAVLLGDLHMFVAESHWPRLQARADVLDQQSRARVREYVRQVVTTLANEPGVIWEVANEYANIGLGESDPFVVELGELVKSLDPDALMNYSAPRDGRTLVTQWMQAPADFVSVHVSRDRGDHGYRWLHDTVDVAARTSAHAVRMPLLSGEPLNFGDARRDGRQGDVEPSPAVAFAYGAASRLVRFSTNFHHDDGLWTAGWGGATERTLAAWKQGLDAVPMLATSPLSVSDAASPWKADVIGPGGPVFLAANGAYSLAAGVPLGWDHAAALKPARRMHVVARVGDGRTEAIVFREER